MDLVSFVSGMISVTFAYALFTSDRDEEVLEGTDFEEYDEDEELSSARTVMMSCQTCRKLKKHKEVEKDLFQCTKCKRHVDLRR